MDACDMCLNAFIDSELTSDNDLSFSGIGECEAGYRILLRSGCARPTAMMVEKLVASGWVTIGYYSPRYCPNCGRKLVENEKKKDR